MKVKLLDEEMKSCTGGEAITLAGVLSVMAISILAVLAYRLFVSSKGSTTLPGGWKFDWGK